MTPKKRLLTAIANKAPEGRWEEADTNLPTEASFHRHTELSQTFTSMHFGTVSAVAYLPDTFGHPATLPKILADTGFKYFIF
ncbi:MAG: hypothetical protein FVQ80_17360, partial [Planctomycetes bacterium]|nr:hypothetical protein [Planctomycetota bacterium]